MSAALETKRTPRKVTMPPLGLAAALMLWGMQNRLWPYAAAMALVLELARLSPWRWHLSDKDYEHIADVSGIGFVVVVIYVFDTYSFQGVYIILQWLPFILFLVALAQRFGTRKDIRYSALFLSVRRAERKGTIEDAGAIDFDLPYMMICMVSATAGESGGVWLFSGLVGVLAYVLWYNRPPNFRPVVWIGVLALAVGLGYLNQIGMLKARRAIEPVVMNFFRDRIMSYRNPFRSYTAMGEIGRLKQSDRILFRVEDLDGGGVPTLLHEASYRSFSKNVWLAGNPAFQEQISDLEGAAWDIEPVPVEGSRAVRISRSLVRGRGMLPLPRGTFRIENLPVEELHKHQLGAFRVNRGPGLIRYTARFAPGRSFEHPPGPADLLVPPDVALLMEGITTDLALQGAQPGEVLKKLQQFFLTRFEYSVVLRRSSPVTTPLHDFLLNTRRGHCEYFASATVLLLRSLGIPARYATGYSVQEYSPLENSYVVRSRHAHSWTQAYINGGWIDFDTTPPAWGALEADTASWWEGAYDLLSWVVFKFSRWRWSSDEDESSTNLLWLIVPLLAVLLWRLVRTQRISERLRGERRHLDRRVQPGADSDLYPLLRALERRGIARQPGEPLGRWLKRLARRDDTDGIGEIVAEMLPVHYRYRFDPRGIGTEERAALRRCVRYWLARYPQ
jgi:hypothetical protein